MKSNADQFTCFIIGEGSLPIQCAKMLLEGGHRILGVISADAEVCRWAQQEGLFVYNPSDDNKAVFASKLISLLQAQPFDYLFSIINSFILPHEILTLPDRYAINYHDAPLPTYAGMYATSWAIMNREVKHGISWHLMTEEIDAGDILKQPMVDIEPHDTALTLNAKCYEAAIAAFGELIDELARDQLTPVPQNLAQRTYFSRYNRPLAGGVISWQQTAEEIDALSRALTFGSYANYLSLPKLLLGEDLFIVAELALPSTGSGTGTVAPPGTIVSIEIDQNQEEKAARTTLTVATSNGSVIIKELLTIDGALCSLSELVTHYELRVGTRLDELSPAMADAITAQNRKIARHEAFWRQRLLTLQPLEPPYSVPSGYRKGVGALTSSSDNIATLALSIPHEVMAFLQERNWTADHFLLTLFALYLTRLNNNHHDVDYFDLALTLAPSVRGVEGFFASQIPLRVAIDAEWPFERAYHTIKRERALCARRRTYARDMVARYPELRSKPELQALPPISVTITETLVSEPLATHDGLSVYLALEEAGTLSATGEPIQGLIAYNRDLFEQEYIGGMVGHLQTLMDELVSEPEQAIKRLPLLTEAERHQILVEWNECAASAARKRAGGTVRDTATDYPSPPAPKGHDKLGGIKGGACVHQLFEEQVERTPDAMAVLFTPIGHDKGLSRGTREQQLTYRELNARANQLAHHLQSLGVGPDVLVGICVERSLEMVVGLLAILKAGGAYVPLDPTYPQERLAFMMQDASLSVLLTQEHLLHLQEGLPLSTAQEFDNGTATQMRTVVCLDSDWADIENYDHDNPSGQIRPDHLAYVMYTSGSTGQPKGVMIEHRSVVNYLQAINNTVLNIPDLMLPFITSITFDANLKQLFGRLVQGQPVWGMTREVIADPIELSRHLNRYDRVGLNCVPTLWHSILEQIEQGTIKLASLQILIMGGEAISKDLLDRTFMAFPTIQIWNVYGPTEATANASLARLSPDTPIHIGSPLENVQCYILNHDGQLVPPGVVGELHIGGVGVARGYLNREALTAEKFVSNPYGSGRLYKTGDLARWLPDGNIEYLGRIDHQVKIRGFRIELGEIENALTKHPMIEETVVVAYDDQQHKELVAYIVPKGLSRGAREQLSQAELIPALRSHLSQRLPDYMVPAAFVTLDAFPLMHNGKINRKALPAPEKGNFVTQSSGKPFVRPQTPREEIVAAIWAEVLGVEQIGREDNFFELGGHSLLAIQVISRLREAFQVEMSVRMMFETPTVAQLAQTVDLVRQTEQQWPVPPPILPVARDAETLLPLSFAQQRLWFLDQLEGPSATYNVPSAFRLTWTTNDPPPLSPPQFWGGGLSVDALETALNQVIERHEILRTTFPTINGQPMQRIHPNLTLPLTVVRLQNARSNAELERLFMEEAKRPFDLAEGPLLRAHLYLLSKSATANTEQVLQLTIHHIISDAWSMDLLMKELSAFYQAAIGGKAAALPELAVQYADFALWQREWLRGEVLERQLGYWQTQLADAPTLLDLPTDHPRPLMQTFNGQTERFELDGELTAQLLSLSRRLGTTSFMTFYAAFAVLMARYSGHATAEVVIGTPIANRHYREIEPLIGFFLNTLALRTDLSDNPSFADLAKQVRQVTLDAYAHQDIPFEQLVEELAVERQLSHSPLFQVMFVWLEQSPPVMLGQEGEIKMERLPLPTVAAKFDLTLFLRHSPETGDGISGMIEYNSDLFERPTIERMVGHFRTLLTGIAANPQQPIGALPLLTEAERQQILVEWNDTQAAYPAHLCVHQLFEQHAAAERTPDAIAIEFGEAQLTYRQLNHYANQLAHYLRALGVGPDVLVGLSLPRSIEMIVGVLAILKAGGAYVPLDPIYPQERLTFMQRDAQIKLLLTHSESAVTAAEETQTLYLDQIGEQLALMPTENLYSGVEPEHLLYVIYTSGSTGRPKGVAMPHRPLTNLIWWQQAQTPLSNGARTLQFSPISFDVSCQEIFSTLAFGGTLVLVDDETRRDGEALRNYLNEQRIERLFLPFVALQAVAEYAQHVPPIALREVITAGEQLQITPAIKTWFSQTNCTLHNHYGPTESHVVTAYTLPKAVDEWTTLPPIGTPIANTQTYILDPSGQPALVAQTVSLSALVPIGVVGELYLGGDALARGYLHRPDLTEERFIPNPFGPGKVYKTGDLARYLPDGNIEFLGRADHQVKIRGFRVELGEIEAVLSQHPAVQEAAVIASDLNSPLPEGEGLGVRGPKRLVAYVVSRQSLPDVIAELRTHLKGQLPDYMVPGAFVSLNALPLTPSGKINRRALPVPSEALSGLEEGYIPPRTPTEETVAAIWGEVLRLEQVGIHDNFFELGGHSLLVTQVTSRVASTFGLNLPVRALFESPTIAELAERIEDDQLVLALSTEAFSEATEEEDATAEEEEFVL